MLLGITYCCNTPSKIGIGRATFTNTFHHAQFHFQWNFAVSSVRYVMYTEIELLKLSIFCALWEKGNLVVGKLCSDTYVL